MPQPLRGTETPEPESARLPSTPHKDSRTSGADDPVAKKRGFDRFACVAIAAPLGEAEGMPNSQMDIRQPAKIRVAVKRDVVFRFLAFQKINDLDLASESFRIPRGCQVMSRASG